MTELDIAAVIYKKGLVTVLETIDAVNRFRGNGTGSCPDREGELPDCHTGYRAVTVFDPCKNFWSDDRAAADKCLVGIPLLDPVKNRCVVSILAGYP